MRTPLLLTALAAISLAPMAAEAKDWHHDNDRHWQHDDHHWNNGWRGREDWRWRVNYRPYVVTPAYNYYYPQPVYYQPQPVYYQPQSSFSFFFRN